MKYLAKVTAIVSTIDAVRAEGMDLILRLDPNDVWLECDSEDFAYLIERLNFEATLHEKEI